MIKTFIKKYQKIITIFFFVFLVLIIWMFPKSQKPIAFPTPTPLPIKFEIRRTIPSSGVGAQILQTSAIEFIFSKQIDLSSISKEERAGVNLELGENRWLDLIKLSANS